MVDSNGKDSDFNRLLARLDYLEEPALTCEFSETPSEGHNDQNSMPLSHNQNEASALPDCSQPANDGNTTLASITTSGNGINEPQTLQSHVDDISQPFQSLPFSLTLPSQSLPSASTQPTQSPPNAAIQPTQSSPGASTQPTQSQFCLLNEPIHSEPVTSTQPHMTTPSQDTTQQQFVLSNSQQASDATQGISQLTPKKTLLALESALRRFSIFFCNRNKLFIEADYPSESLIKLDYSHALDCTREFLFSDDDGNVFPRGFTNWPESTLFQLRYYLTQFSVNFKYSAASGQVNPITMKGYILRLQRALHEIWGYKIRVLEGPVFNCPREGLIAAFNKNTPREQYHNRFAFLSKADVVKLYSSDMLSMDTSKGLQRRMIFNLSLLTGMTPDGLIDLKVHHIMKISIDGEHVWRIRIQQKPRRRRTQKIDPSDVLVFNDEYYNGLINVYEDIEKYMQVRLSLFPGCNYDRLLMGVVINATSFNNFLQAQPQGRDITLELMRQTCEYLDIPIAKQRLSGMAGTTLFEDGHSNSRIRVPTSHRKTQFLKSFVDLQAKQRQIQKPTSRIRDSEQPEEFTTPPPKRARSNDNRVISINLNDDNITIHSSQKTSSSDTEEGSSPAPFNITISLRKKGFPDDREGFSVGFAG